MFARIRLSELDRFLIFLIVLLATMITLVLFIRAQAEPAPTVALLPTARVNPPDQGLVDFDTIPAERLPAIPPQLGPDAQAQPSADSAATPELATLSPLAPTMTPVPLALPQVAAPPPAGPEVPLGAPPQILMYHYIRWVDQASDPLGFDLSVTPDMFARQMAWLADNGYTGIRMDRMMACLRGASLCPPKPVVLTFDDGYQDAYDEAFPILQRHGFTATFYIVSNFVNQPGYMNWGELMALYDAGMEIGSHTVDHYDLTTLDPYEANRQIVQSKADIERGLGQPVVSFCYPVGKYTGPITVMVSAAGYESATTTRNDWDYSNPFTLPRVRVSGSTTLDGFVTNVGG
jgi:peptidoglycan/xylan/chitin deacetylase (PgdA/CDA1 family)